MRVGLYMRAGQLCASGLHAGLEALGHVPVYRRPLFKGLSDCEPFDVVVTLGWKGVAGIIRKSYARRGVPAVVVDAPWFGPYGAGLWRLSAGDDPGWLFPEGAPPARATKLRALPRFTRKRPAPDAPVLLCGQVPGDAAHDLPSKAAVVFWAEETLAAIRLQVDRPVIWRSHPAAPVVVSGVDAVSDPEEPIAEAVAGCYAVVTVSSGTGLDALAAGVPVVATGFPAYGGLASTLDGLRKIAPPPLVGVQDLFSRLAYQHWGEDEMATGAGLELFLDLAAGKAPEWPTPPPAPTPKRAKAPPTKTKKPARKRARKPPARKGA